jgi:hypothetical protein
MQSKAGTNFVFNEFHLTRRAKQGHYAMLAPFEEAPDSRHTRRAESLASRNLTSGQAMR